MSEVVPYGEMAAKNVEEAETQSNPTVQRDIRNAALLLKLSREEVRWSCWNRYKRDRRVCFQY